MNTPTTLSRTTTLVVAILAAGAGIGIAYISTSVLLYHYNQPCSLIGFHKCAYAEAAMPGIFVLSILMLLPKRWSAYTFTAAISGSLAYVAVNILPIFLFVLPSGMPLNPYFSILAIILGILALAKLISEVKSHSSTSRISYKKSLAITIFFVVIAVAIVLALNVGARLLL